ncbi:permease [Paenibacillus solanacearum]
MIMEAIPFVLIGVLLSGLIQIYLKERWIVRIMPRSRIVSSMLGCALGILFPACECGIVPITRRLLGKGVPLHAGIAFMLTAPIINPIVLFSTYIAFGSSWTMVFARAGLALAVALAVSVTVGYLFPALPLRSPTAEPQIAASSEQIAGPASSPPLSSQIIGVCEHAIEEFFSVGKYLILGAFIAACIQTYVPTSSLLSLGSSPVTASLLMMGLGFVMSLCSEADAFIASSFRSTFSIGSLSSFLVFGAMIDIKNTLMLLAVFRGKFVLVLIALVAAFTLLGSLLIGRLLH